MILLGRQNHTRWNWVPTHRCGISRELGQWCFVKWQVLDVEAYKTTKIACSIIIHLQKKYDITLFPSGFGLAIYSRLEISTLLPGRAAARIFACTRWANKSSHATERTVTKPTSVTVDISTKIGRSGSLICLSVCHWTILLIDCLSSSDSASNGLISTWKGWIGSYLSSYDFLNCF